MWEVSSAFNHVTRTGGRATQFKCGEIGNSIYKFGELKVVFLILGNQYDVEMGKVSRMAGEEFTY